MSGFFVALSSIDDVKHFVDAASRCPCEVDVLSGRYVINAKSIMGLFSLGPVPAGTGGSPRYRRTARRLPGRRGCVPGGCGAVRSALAAGAARAPLPFRSAYGLQARRFYGRIAGKRLFRRGLGASRPPSGGALRKRAAPVAVSFDFGGAFYDGTLPFFCLSLPHAVYQSLGLMRNTFQENIQEHSHVVAVLAHALAVIRREVFGGEIDPGLAAAAALFHDAPEILTGDLPTPVKYYNPETGRL